MTYLSEVLADTPKALWMLGESSGNPLDSSGNGKGMTWGDPAVQNVAGLLADSSLKAADFNGSGDRATANDTTSYWGGVTGYIEAWVRIDASGGTYTIFSRHDGSWTGARVQRLVLGVNTARRPFLQFWVTDGGADQQITANTVMTVGATYHIVAGYNATSDTARIYVNGVSDATPVVVAGALQYFGQAGAPAIGFNQGFSTNFFNGVMQAVAYYDYEPSAARILAHYTAGTTTIPGVPTGLTVDDETLTTLEVSWDAATGSPTGYRVRLDGGAATDVGNVLTHEFTGLTPGTTYAVQVQAYNGAGDSAWSTAVDGTTDDLLAPGGLAIVATTATTVSVEWDTSVGALGYEVRADGGDPTDVGDVLEHTFTDLEPGASHTLEVRAYA